MADRLRPFKLERYFSEYEFSAPYLLCCSDCEALGLGALLGMADDETAGMWNNLKLGYTESLGHPLLRHEVSKLYKTIDSRNVLVLTPEEGIFIAMNNLLDRGDHVITAFPAYQSLYEIADSLSCEISRWTPVYDGTWSFDINELENLIRDNTRLIVINFPHNPTGATISEEELKRIVKIARERDIMIFSDEMYRYLEYRKEERISSACDLYENAVSLFGMSKSFSLAGLRIGWLTTRNTALFNKFALYKDYTTICSSGPSEILAIMALRAKEEIIGRNIDLIASNLKILDDFFLEYKELFEWKKPGAGPIGFPLLKGSIGIDEFCRDLITGKGVMLLPASQYGFAGNYFRIGFARSNIKESLDKLGEYLDDKTQNQ